VGERAIQPINVRPGGFCRARPGPSSLSLPSRWSRTMRSWPPVRAGHPRLWPVHILFGSFRGPHRRQVLASAIQRWFAVERLLACLWLW